MPLLPFLGRKKDCPHPELDRVWLREDPLDRNRPTAVKCTRCGARLGPPRAPDSARS
jgi:uncharacterized OB-fold protein